MLHLSNKRILVTQANDFMGPAICEELRACGAEVMADERMPIAPQDAQDIVAKAGPIDALVINLALPAPTTPVSQIEKDEWQRVFDVMVHPLPRLRCSLCGLLVQRSRQLLCGPGVSHVGRLGC